MINLINSINFYFYKIKLQCEFLKSESFFTDDYIKLTNFLDKSNKMIHEDFLDKTLPIFEAYQKGENKENLYITYYDDVAVYFRYFDLFNQYISFAMKSSNIKIHQGIFILIKEMFSILEDPPKFIISPEFRLNFSYMDISNRLNELISFSGEKKISNFLLFVVPSFNQNEILNNSILGHEIGHYFEEKEEISKDIIDDLVNIKLIKRNMINDIVNERYENLKTGNDDLDKIEIECYDEWLKKAEKWIKELVSDMIGLRIFGMAYFFAFIETISQTRSVGGRNNHPPTFLRVKHLIKLIKEDFLKKWNELEDNENENLKKLEIVPKIREMIHILERRYPEDDGILSFNDLNKITFDICKMEETTNNIQEKVDDLVSKKLIKEYDMANAENLEEINYLISLMTEYIIPNENLDSNPANVISILNAGWFFYCFNINNHYKLFNLELSDYSYEMTIKKMKVEQRLHSLILKAIELSNIQKTIGDQL